MRIFQNSGLYPAYFARLDRLANNAKTYAGRRTIAINDRFGAPHILLPIMQGREDAAFTNGDDIALQRMWAAEHGMPSTTTLEQILLAQIEAHRTEVFYNLDPMRYGSNFVRKLPSCVKHSIAWRAAPSPSADFEAYSLVVCNFPSILRSYEARGWQAGYFAPSHDPVMDTFAVNQERPVEVLFVGGYSRHHRRRAEVLEAVAGLSRHYKVSFHLDRSRVTRWAESALGRCLPLGTHRRPEAIQAVGAEPVFGLDLYVALSRAKIVLNGAVDMAGTDRGNMRCFEAMGCGALMVSDDGQYPDGMVDGATMRTYKTAADTPALIERMLKEPEQAARIARHGRELMQTQYSKARQWEKFLQLVSALPSRRATAEATSPSLSVTPADLPKRGPMT